MRVTSKSFRTIRFLSVLTLSLLLAAESKAALITLDFTARIDSVRKSGANDLIPQIDQGIIIGTTEVTGSLTYETNQPGFKVTNSSGDFGVYDYTRVAVSLPLISYLFEFSDPLVGGSINVRDDVNFGYGANDQILLQSSIQDYAFAIGRPVLALGLSNASTTVFDSTGLPTALTLSDFPNRSFSLGVDQRRRSWEGHIVLEGEITSISAAQVPTPGTLALLGLGIAGLGFAQRKKA